MPENSIVGVPAAVPSGAALRVLSSLLHEAVLGRRLRVTEAVRVPVLRARPLRPEMAAVSYSVGMSSEGAN